MRRLGFFLNEDEVGSALLERGMSAAASERCASRFAHIGRVLLGDRNYRERGVAGYWAPGRIEILGKHTDYAGGLSLVAALERGFCMLALPEPSEEPVAPLLTLRDVQSGESMVIQGSMASNPALSWSVYPRTVLNRGCLNFGPLRVGGSLVFWSDLPPAAGMSSSSAFMVAIFLALQEMNGWDKTAAYRTSIADRVDLADYLGHVENGQTYRSLQGEKGVGTFGGSQDHTAILCSRPREATLFSFIPTRLLEAAPIPGDLAFCLACSGVRAEKTQAARAQYNRAASRAHEVVAVWNREAGASVRSLAEVMRQAAFDLETFGRVLNCEPEGEALEGRLMQFHAETTQCIPTVIKSLQSGDRAGLAAAVKRSQMMAERHLGNQIPETIHLTRSAERLGAIAASSFGAGFGGSVWALVEASACERFLEAWRRDYRRAYPQHAAGAEFFKDATGPAALSL